MRTVDSLSRKDCCENYLSFVGGGHMSSVRSFVSIHAVMYVFCRIVFVCEQYFVIYSAISGG